MSEHVCTVSRSEEHAFWNPYQATCSCGWEGLAQSSERLAELDYKRHERLLSGDTKGMYECGCHPDDIDPFRFGQKLGRKKQCPTHRQPYVPKTDPKTRKPPAVSTEEILAALRRRHTEGDYDRHAPWFFVEELRVDAGGYGRVSKMRQLHDGKGNPRFLEDGRPMLKRVDFDRQSLDAFAFSMWKRDKHDRICYEVKVTRSDFLNEIKKPWKREAGMALSNKFIYVTPPGLLKPDEVPEHCGLMEVHPSGHIRTVVKPKHRDVGPPPMEFIVALLRRANLILRDRD